METSHHEKETGHIAAIFEEIPVMICDASQNRMIIADFIAPCGRVLTGNTITTFSCPTGHPSTFPASLAGHMTDQPGPYHVGGVRGQRSGIH